MIITEQQAKWAGRSNKNSPEGSRKVTVDRNIKRKHEWLSIKKSSSGI